MKKQTYYRIDSKGRTRQWSIWTEKISNSQFDIVTEDGIVGGKLKGSRTPITEGLGKNSIEGQAIADAQSVINKKTKDGYGLDLSNLKTKGETATIKVPMKAETLKLKPTEKEATKTFTLQRAGIEGKVVRFETKLDGWRYRIKVNRSGVTFYTSSGDVSLEFAHITSHIQNVFDKNIDYWEKKYGITEHILDGEIYNHNLGFQLVASACGSTVNITPEKQALRDQMQFYIFDVAIDDKTVLDSTRQSIIKYYIDNKNVVPVKSEICVANEANVNRLMKQWLSEGYEGLMVKVLNTPYEFKRSKFVFKYKPIIDEEFQICGFKKSITGETLGSIECKMADGRTFFATGMDYFGTDEMKQKIWNNKSEYLGKWVTCIFLNYTDENVPRHPRVKCFRKGKSKD